MSTNEPEVVSLDSGTVTATIRDVVATDELSAFFDQPSRRSAELISAQGVAITGPAFSLYHDHPSATADVEVGFPTDRRDRALRRGAPERTSARGAAAWVVHEGGYDKLDGLGPTSATG